MQSIAYHLAGRIPNNAILLGWSFGGLIAIELASLYPEKVKQLILLSSQPRFSSDTDWIGVDQGYRNMFLNLAKKTPKQQMEQFIRLASYPSRSSTARAILRENSFSQVTPRCLSLLTILFDTDLRDKYQQLGVNILHVIYTQDAVLPQTSGQLQRLNSHVHVKEFSGLGHAGFLTDRLIFNDTVNDFINNAE